MKKTATVLAYLLFPIAAVLIASMFGNIFITLGALLISLLILAFILRADLFMLLGTLKYSKDSARGLRLMNRAMSTGKLRPKNRLFYAYLLVRNGRLDEAESIINKTTYLGKNILSDADLKTAEFNLALISWKRGDLNSAIMQTEELYSEGYLNSNLYGTLGYFYIANGELEKSIEISKEGIEYNPDDLITRDNLGQAYIASGNLDEAQEIYDTILEKEPKFMEPYYNYATLLEKHGELSEAAQFYRNALEYPEKYMSTITHAQISDALSRVEELLK